MKHTRSPAIAAAVLLSLTACPGNQDASDKSTKKAGAKKTGGEKADAKTPDAKTPDAKTPDAKQPDEFQPMPIPKGFGFPGQRTELQAIADAYDVAKIRKHAWDLWAGMTTNATKLDGQDIPYWDTWCGDEELKNGTCNDPRPQPSRTLVIARQHTHSADKDAVDEGRVISFNKFNPAMADFLMMTDHPGPGDATYNYLSKDSLATLNAAWPQDTSIADRKIQETPYVAPSGDEQGVAAMELKPVVFLVKAKGGLTRQPLWRGTAASTNPNNPTPPTWKHCVLVDPTKPEPVEQSTLAEATEEQKKEALGAPLACETYYYAPLGSMYHFQLDAEGASEWNTLITQSGDGGQKLTAEAGDFAVLVGMHVNTKEIVNWTWQTFWWQPGDNPPEDFPGSKNDNDNPKIVKQWRNYAMCSAYTQTKGASSKEMQVCFNPYLETSAGIPDGIQSNCMTCHGTATSGALDDKGNITTLSYPASYTKPIDFNTDPMFKDFTKNDFSWAITGIAQ